VYVDLLFGRQVLHMYLKIFTVCFDSVYLVRILNSHNSLLSCHLSLMGIINDPTCNYCEEGLETACSYVNVIIFVTLRQEIWGKSFLHLSEADSVQNLVRFIQKSHRVS